MLPTPLLEIDHAEIPDEPLSHRLARLRALAERLAHESVQMRDRARLAIAEAREARHAAREARAWCEQLAADPGWGRPARQPRAAAVPPPPPPPDQPLPLILYRLREGDLALAHEILGPRGTDLAHELYQRADVQERFRVRRANSGSIQGGVHALRNFLARAARITLRRAPNIENPDRCDT